MPVESALGRRVRAVLVETVTEHVSRRPEVGVYRAGDQPTRVFCADVWRPDVMLSWDWDTALGCRKPSQVCTSVWPCFGCNFTYLYLFRMARAGAPPPNIRMILSPNDGHWRIPWAFRAAPQSGLFQFAPYPTTVDRCDFFLQLDNFFTDTSASTSHWRCQIDYFWRLLRLKIFF